MKNSGMMEKIVARRRNQNPIKAAIQSGKMEATTASRINAVWINMRTLSGNVASAATDFQAASRKKKIFL
jgi:hypothetical protein